MLVAVDEFLDDHAITPPIAKATAEIAILKGSITELATLAANQDAGRGEWRGASDDRVRLKAALSDKLSEISAIAKVLDPVLYPTARQQFKMTVNGSFISYITRGNAFLQVIGPIKAAFVDHGLAADFDEALSDAVTQLEEAGAHAENALQHQMTGTAGMELAAKRGVKEVRVLDSIMRPRLKATPALLEVWEGGHQDRAPAEEGDDRAADPCGESDRGHARDRAERSRTRAATGGSRAAGKWHIGIARSRIAECRRQNERARNAEGGLKGAAR